MDPAGELERRTFLFGLGGAALAAATLGGQHGKRATAPFSSAGPKMGCTVFAQSGGLSGLEMAISQWNDLVLEPVGMTARSRKYYLGKRPWPVFSATKPPDPQIQAALAYNQTLIVCFKPRFMSVKPWGYTSDTKAMIATLKSIIHESGSWPGMDASKVKAVIWQEVTNSPGTQGYPTAREYVELVRFHQALRSASRDYPGVGLWHDITRNSTTAKHFFPGPGGTHWHSGTAGVDASLVDWYGNNYIDGHYPNADANLALGAGIPFGFGEFGNYGSASGTKPTPAQFKAMLTGNTKHSMLAVMQNHLTNGGTLSVCDWYVDYSSSVNATFSYSGGTFKSTTWTGTQGDNGGLDWQVVLNSGAPGPFTAGTPYYVVNYSSSVSGGTTTTSFQLGTAPRGNPITTGKATSGTMTANGVNSILAASDYRIPLIQQLASLS